MSLKSIIEHYVEKNYPRAVHKGEIGRKAVMEWGYENENSGRRCRELENEGILEKIYNEKHEVMYRFIPPEQRTKPESPPKLPKKFWQGHQVVPVTLPPAFEKQKVEINQTLF